MMMTHDTFPINMNSTTPHRMVEATENNIMSEYDHDNHHQQTIFFRLMNGKTITLTVNPNIEILHMKQMLLQKITLLESTKVVSDTNTNMNNNSLIVVTKLLSIFWVTSYLLVPHLLRVQDMSFIYCGKPLDDDCTWYDYMNYSKYNNNNTNIPTIHVSTKLYGGCFMISASVLGMIITAIIGSTCTCGLSLIAVPFLLPLLFILPFFCL